MKSRNSSAQGGSIEKTPSFIPMCATLPASTRGKTPTGMPEKHVSAVGVAALNWYCSAPPWYPSPILLCWPGPGPPKSPEPARLITACPHIASSAGAPVAHATLEHKSLLETRIVVSWLARAPHRRAGRRPPNRRRVFSAPWTRKSTRRLASWGGVPGQRPVGFSHTVQKHVSRPLWHTMQALRQLWRPN